VNNIFVVLQVTSGVRIKILPKDFDQLLSDYLLSKGCLELCNEDLTN